MERDPKKSRRCSKCGETKPETEFYWKNRSLGRLRSDCRTCFKRVSAAHYAKNTDYYVGKAKERKAMQREVLRGVIDNARDRPCSDCENTFPVVVMQFDHVRGEKDFNVSEAPYAGYSVERVRAEIAKCDVVCANCHAVRTDRRRKE